MDLSIISVYTGGVLTLLMALFHTRFEKIFGWNIEFKRVSERNTKILYTIHLALLLLFFGLGIITIMYADELSKSTGLSFGLNIIISLFWLWRAIWQVAYFKPDKKSKLRNIHYVLLIIFILLAVSFGVPVILSI